MPRLDTAKAGIISRNSLNRQSMGAIRNPSPFFERSTTGSDILSRFPVPNFNFRHPSEQQFAQAKINKAFDDREKIYLAERDRRLNLQKKLLRLFQIK